jgi:hypothetical protein
MIVYQASYEAMQHETEKQNRFAVHCQSHANLFLSISCEKRPF